MGTKDDKEEKYRMLASISFVAVLIVVGVPLWWKTTEVYRVALPYDRIASLDKLDIRIVTNLTIVANDDATAAEIRDMVTEHFSKSEVLNVQVETRILDPDLQHGIDEEPDESTAASMVMRQLDLKLGPDHLALVQRPRLYNKLWIGNQRVLFFKNNLGAQSLMSALSLVVWQERSLEGARAARAADVSRRRRVPPAASYHVALAVLNPDPLAHRVDLDAHHTAQKYLRPFLEELRELHNYTLTTQWLYLLELDVGNKQVPDDSPFKRHFAVSEDRLSHLLTALESRLASPGAREPTLHLVLYAPPCERAPLHIYRDNMERAGGEVDAFLSARWGGVMVSNPSHEECAEVLRGDSVTAHHAPDPRHLAGVLLLQLRQLLGINEPEWLDDVRVLPLTSVSPRRWELDALLRIRTLEQLVSAKLTLTSLSQLLGEISNIVINDAVGASVQTAVTSVESASRALKDGDLRRAFGDSQRAFLAAEAAFTDPTLLALLYFPDDQKYAVYIPLFLPVMIPVFLSLDNIYKWLRSKPGKEKSD